ncbi:hypothetical protein [Spiroplasma sp. SV19]|uniref:hypothetical protein n=1 Tax=Spiroplasma sp. SV19 TaxID=2570468 RepID=UPI0024B74116|nr:hypothetical protein [Spiroplasma sp. SV19]WHQ36696.1 hypothetical protein E7Y35_02130 [Spiroplasma sp. SV19]
MNKFLKHIIKKIKFSLSLFIPGTFNSLRSKYGNDTEFDYAYILTDSIHQENVINETEVTLINEENNCQYNKQIVRKINCFTKPSQNVVLVLLGFVVWFFKVKKNTLPPQVL